MKLYNAYMDAHPEIVRNDTNNWNWLYGSNPKEFDAWVAVADTALNVLQAK